MSSGFEPRLLLPGAPDLPQTIPVGHDLEVCDELTNPANSAIVYVPKWSASVRRAFNLIAGHTVHDARPFEATGGKVTNLHNFLARQTCKWLLPAIGRWQSAVRNEVIGEVVEQQLAFLAALRRNQPGYDHKIESSWSPFYKDKKDRLTFSLPPARSFAHLDGRDNALFAAPVGTVLVDQEGLDIRRLAGEMLILGVKHLAGRLWQVPGASFAAWQGIGSPNPQFHFFPQVPQDLMRYRLFAQP